MGVQTARRALAVAAAMTLVLIGATIAPAVALEPAPTSDERTGRGAIVFGRDGDIWTIRANGSDERRLTTSRRVGAPVFSPDGRHILYVRADHAGQYDLFIMRTNGSHPRRLTTTGGIGSAGGSWSPDGQRVAFSGPCFDNPEHPDLCESSATTFLNTIAVDSPTGVPETVVGCYDKFEECGDEGYPQWAAVSSVLDRVAWSPNGKWIAYYSTDYPSSPDRYLLVYSVPNRYVDAVWSVGHSGHEGSLGYPAWSSDGMIAFNSNETSEGEVLYQGVKLCTWPGRDCDRFAEVYGDHRVAFSSDGRRAVLENTTVGQLLVARADGTDRHVLTSGYQPDWR